MCESNCIYNDVEYVLNTLLKRKKSNVIEENDIDQTCNKYNVPKNNELINDLSLFTNIKKNFKCGKTLLLLILSYKQIVPYDTMLNFNLCGNGKSEKRNLKNSGFIFEDIGSGIKKDLKCIGFDINKTITRNMFSKKIKEHFQTIPQKCYMCGSKCNLEIDHRKPICRNNSLPYNDNDSIDSYQLLCNRCNTLKRQQCIKCQETNIINNRPDIMHLNPKIKQVYNNTCEGCYYYDCRLC